MLLWTGGVAVVWGIFLCGFGLLVLGRKALGLLRLQWGVGQKRSDVVLMLIGSNPMLWSLLGGLADFSKESWRRALI